MEQAKLRMLLENHHTSAYRWALFCCEGDRHEAEDVLQTVYLNVLERSASFEEAAQQFFCNFRVGCGNRILLSWLSGAESSGP